MTHEAIKGELTCQCDETHWCHYHYKQIVRRGIIHGLIISAVIFIGMIYIFT